jgi:hypothetical protein
VIQKELNVKKGLLKIAKENEKGRLINFVENRDLL